MRAALRDLDQTYRQLKHAYEDQARLIGRPRKPSEADLDRAADAVRQALDAFDTARRAVEAAVREGIRDDE